MPSHHPHLAVSRCMAGVSVARGILQAEEGAPCLPSMLQPLVRGRYLLQPLEGLGLAAGDPLVLDSSAQPNPLLLLTLLVQWGCVSRPTPGCSPSLSVSWPLFWMVSPNYDPASSPAVLSRSAPPPGAILATLPLLAAALHMGRLAFLSPDLSGPPLCLGHRTSRALKHQKRGLIFP